MKRINKLVKEILKMDKTISAGDAAKIINGEISLIINVVI